MSMKEPMVKMRNGIQWWAYDFTNHGRRYRGWIGAITEMDRRQATVEQRRIWMRIVTKNERCKTEGVNPFKGVSKFDEKPMKRYLPHGELIALVEALSKSKHPDLKLIVLFHMLTRMCLSKILRLRKENIKLNQCDMAVSTGRQKRPILLVSKIPQEIEASLVSHLQSSRSGYIFENPKTERPWNDIKKAWEKVITDAGIEYVGIGDLRNSLHP